MEVDDTEYFLHVTGRTSSPSASALSITCIGPGSGIAGEQGEQGEPGTPGADGADGADGSTVIVLHALVNAAGDVAATDATFAFDGGVEAGGLGPAGGGTGTCENPGRAFCDNEEILVIGDGDGDWVAVKLSNNIIRALVNEGSHVASTDADFTFDGVSAITGVGPGTSPPVAVNTCNLFFEDNEELILWQRDDGDWEPVKLRHFIRIKGAPTATVTADDTTFSVSTYTVLQGSLPTGTLTITNAAKIPLATSETNTEYQWNQDQHRWETLPRVAHTVMGKATAAVSGGAFTIDNIELVHGSDPRTDPTSTSETLSIANPFAFNIDDNGDVLATKKADLTWIAIQADCPA
jgi:hypothetical protein